MNITSESPFNCRLPLSSSMPAYSKLNHRRRITCRTCGLPLGYVPLCAAYLETELSKLYKMTNERLKNRCSQQARSKSSLMERFLSKSVGSNLHNADMADLQNKPSKRLARSQSSLIQRFLSKSVGSNLHNADMVDLQHKPPKRLLLPSYLTHDRMDENIDNRMFLSVFLPDAVNVRVSRRCSSAEFQADVDDPCGIPHNFKFLGDQIQSTDNVTCTGCNTCLGVRFQPATSNQKGLIASLHSSRGSRSLTRSSFANQTTTEEAIEFVDRELPRLSSIFHGHLLSMNTVEEEGWISLSLERVMIEPLFGLVGLEQFSIRYEGGEMFPQFYRSIETSSLLSQNSATWMWPTRRSKDQRVPNMEQGSKLILSWGKTYYDLERVEKTVPHTLGHGDLMAATIRRLTPIYPLQDDLKTKKEPDEAKHMDKTI